jgi:RHH-type proline utilization regulon transcriptional repressor/proline dehydrogenase/delta 1-pyrroline-5-carboxylate dehydrogenase
MRVRIGPGARFDERLIGWAARRPEVRAALFRFTDAAPACLDLADAGRHLHGFLAEVEEPPAGVALAARLSGVAGLRSAAGAVAMQGVKRMGRRFILAPDAEAALGPLGRLRRSGLAGSLDLLGEATVSEYEADAYAARCRATLETLSRGSAAWPRQPLLDHDTVGPLPAAHLSIKVSALTADLRPDAPERGIAGARDRLRELFRSARDLDAHLHVDMESFDHRDAVQRSVLELLTDPEFGDGPSVGIVQQAYLRDSEERLTEVIDWAQANPRSPPLLIRLVKGAYWDHEVVQAGQAGWTAPVFEDRGACDRNFERLSRSLIDAHPVVRTAIASHNLRSVAHALAYQRSLELDLGDVEYQVLYGLGDEIRAGLAGLGARVRTYCPIGDLVAGMAYLVRRLLENTANDSFLAARAAGRRTDTLLAAP